MLVRRLARPLLASVFVAVGVEALRHPGARTDRAAKLLEQVPHPPSLPDDPDLLVRANGAVLVGGGVLLATGRLPRLASTLLAASLVPTTAIEHAFWEEADPQRRSQQQALFLRDVGLLGGLLLAAVDTAGKPGLAWRAQHATRTTRREARHARRAARREARLLVHRAHDVVS
ncbi:MAG TPA: DoxX family protein [Intrasporangium sp.]|uniref:DoxX family protein n=1 Tax=Intrasporangium sp. TaxID=1925024 RepID=UPI002D79472A|nr:DoxX family protein [Intrasporangium sp.]HET7398319.1 DoxX family protein [Intrasporangium sp.]